MNMHKSESVQQFSEELYRSLKAQGVDVILMIVKSVRV
ncbi:prolyl-tRNA synthetase [Actinobacillus equuli]|nr:prolyl-tRNA synthetase [Actinobacillus equuli]